MTSDWRPPNKDIDKIGRPPIGLDSSVDRSPARQSGGRRFKSSSCHFFSLIIQIYFKNVPSQFPLWFIAWNFSFYFTCTNPCCIKYLYFTFTSGPNRKFKCQTFSKSLRRYQWSLAWTGISILYFIFILLFYLTIKPAYTLGKNNVIMNPYFLKLLFDTLNEKSDPFNVVMFL